MLDLKQLLAMLRAQYWLYQSLHWHSSGEPSYGDHLLYERLYQKAYGEVDHLAEKIIGLGAGPIDQIESIKHASEYIEQWLSSKELIDSAISAEQDLQDKIEEIYTERKKAEDLSLGLDDFLMSLSNGHEENQYLLIQRSKNAGRVMINQLMKIANEMDRDGLFEYADKIDSIISKSARMAPAGWVFETKYMGGNIYIDPKTGIKMTIPEGEDQTGPRPTMRETPMSTRPVGNPEVAPANKNVGEQVGSKLLNQTLPWITEKLTGTEQDTGLLEAFRQ